MGELLPYIPAKIHADPDNYYPVSEIVEIAKAHCLVEFGR